MTVTVSRIFQGNLNPLEVETSSIFTDGLFLLFQTDTPDDTAFDIGVGLRVDIPTGTSIQTKDVPLEFLEKNVASTFETAFIPAEYRQGGFEMFLGFNSAIEIINLQVWLVSSDTTLDSIADDVENLAQQIEENQELIETSLALDIAQAINAVAQSFTLLTYSTALAPLTLGATAPTIPALTAGINFLLGTGLPLLP